MQAQLNAMVAVRQTCDKLIASRPLSSLAHMAGEREISVGAAVGVAIYPHDGADAGSLLKRADLNVYQKKQRRDARDRWAQRQLYEHYCHAYCCSSFSCLTTRPR